MYRVAVRVVRFLIKLFWGGLEVDGLDNIPARGGGAIIVANHNTWFDPVAIAAASARPVHFMAKVELFKNPLLRWFFTKVYAFRSNGGRRIARRFAPHKNGLPMAIFWVYSRKGPAM